MATYDSYNTPNMPQLDFSVANFQPPKEATYELLKSGTLVKAYTVGHVHVLSSKFTLVIPERN